MMLINNVEDGKGFKDFDILKKNPGIFFRSEHIYLKKFLDYKNDEQPIGFLSSGSSYTINIVNEKIYNNFDKNSIKYDFDDDEKKVWLTVNKAFYHFFMDTMASIIILNNAFPGIKFIIDVVDVIDNKHDVYFQFLYDFLKIKKINYVLIDKPFTIKINNFFQVTTLVPSDFIINEIYSFSKTYTKKNNIKPEKKVYISRKFTPCHRDTNEFEYHNIDINEVGYSDIRVYDENQLEDFFKVRGFEIVYAEKFSSIKEQIEYFSDVKLVVAATSSGLLNLIFMPPEGVVIELMTPFVPGVRDAYELHSSQYLEMSYVKKHNYLGIPSKFYGRKIINYFLNNKIISEILLSD